MCAPNRPPAALHAELLEDRHQRFPESVERFLGLPHVDNSEAEAVRTLACDVSQQTLDRPLGGGVHTALAARYSDDRLLVPLLCKSRRLKDRYDWHRYLLASRTAGAYGWFEREV
jgi:hypothetical protein